MITYTEALTSSFLRASVALVPIEIETTKGVPMSPEMTAAIISTLNVCAKSKIFGIWVILRSGRPRYGIYLSHTDQELVYDWDHRIQTIKFDDPELVDVQIVI